MKADLGIGMLPPENATSTTMYSLKRRIHLYAKTHNQLPKALEQLPPLEGFNNRTKDVWGNKIILKQDGYLVSLISFGKDQKPGGSEGNRDVVGIFNTRLDNKNWAGENSPWFKKPLESKNNQ